MTLWTTFCPQKVCWELTYRATNGDVPTSDWQKNKSLIKDSLTVLKKKGISGIRLVIFPYEITDGKNYDFSPIEYSLEACSSIGLQVDFCLGPFQYPHYPGIRLPYPLCQKVTSSHTTLDTDIFFWRFGLSFLETQLKKYGKDQRIRGFYLGNEWPDRQKIERREHIATSISHNFMLQAVMLTKDVTDKPVFFNTNIEASLPWRMRAVYKEFFVLLGKRARLGLDVYPSQETWKERLLHRLFPYARAVSSLTTLLPRDQMLFSELEAQPWGGGRAWDYYLKQANNPQQQVLTYSRDSLPESWKRYVLPSHIQEVNLWGSDFWLVCHAAHVTWPLEQIQELVSSKYLLPRQG